MKIQNSFINYISMEIKKIRNMTPPILLYILIISFVGFIITLVYFGRAHNKEFQDGKIMIGKKIINLKGYDLNEEIFSVEKFRQKILVLCYVDKVECAQCEKELMYFRTLYNELKDIDKVMFIAIVNNTNRYNIIRFKKLHKLPYRIIIDETGNIRRTLKIYISPVRMIIANNTIIFLQDYKEGKKEDQLKFKRFIKNLIT